LGLSSSSFTDTVTLYTSFNWSFGQDVVDTMIHEISEGGMGRVGGLGVGLGGRFSTMDLFSFNGSGVRDLSTTDNSRFFSFDGGLTTSQSAGLSYFPANSGNDAADFQQLDVFGTGDPGETNTISQTDINEMEALGWTPPSSDTAPPTRVHDGSITLATGATATIPESQLQFDDNVSSHAQEVFAIITAPADGVLLKSGQPTSSFTQADIDNGLVSYHEIATGVNSDSFAFTVTDAANNSTALQHFALTITSSVSTLDSMPPASFGTGGTSDTIAFGTDGTLTIFSTTNGTATQSFNLGKVGTDNTFGAVGHFFGSAAASDFIMRGPQGQLELYQIQNDQVANAFSLGEVGLDFQIISVGDYFQNGTDDMLMRSVVSGRMELYQFQNGQIINALNLGAIGPDQQIVGQGNFFNNGTEDFMAEQNSTGLLGLYQVKNGQIVGFSLLGAAGSDAHVIGIGDFNGDGVSDALIQRDNGALQIYGF
jgi:hypothetical protein